MKKEMVHRCRFCGNPVMVIEWGVYRKVVTDAEAVEVIADPAGEEYVRIDGTKFRAREAEPGTIEAGTEWAYRIHRKTCGVGK